MAGSEGRWNDAGTLVWFADALDAEHETQAGLERWWLEGELDPVAAWVVYLWDRTKPDGWHLTKLLVDAPGVPAIDEVSRALVLKQALTSLAAGPPPLPLPVRFGDPTNTSSGLQTLIRQVGEGLMRAESRVYRAAQVKTDDSELRIAVFDTMAWLRALDEVFERAWNGAAAARRQDVSLATDGSIARLQASGASLGIFDDALRARSDSGEPYADWALALFRGNVTRNELLGFRWLAGKLLHHGPRRCTELVQWTHGAEPRWKWIAASLVVPEASTEKQRLQDQREAYEQSIEGRDVSGMMGFNEIVLEGENFFRRLYAPTWARPAIPE